MKKLLIVLAFAGVSMCSMAQDADPVQKYSVATNSFWSNWFIQVGADWNAWYSGQEHGMDLEKSPFKDFRSGPGAAVAIGKWFTPGLGLRTKLQGIWGKSVNDDVNAGNFNKYWILNEHILFNLSNMLLGYNPNRVWNFIPFAGGGVGRTMTHNLYAMGLSAGILNEFNVSRHVAINLELGWNRYEGDLDGNENVGRPNRGWDSHDNNLYGEVGLTFNLGRATWDKTPDVDAIKALSQSQIDALNAQLNDANAENARLKEMLANQKPAESVKEFVTTPVSVFFNLNKTNIASKKDLVNVEAVAKYAKENDRKLVVNGYADSATGKPDHNQWLSEKRAETVANELVNMGVSRDNITTKGNGGVDELSPISFNRRATVEVAE
ncbi:OmpA family protein [Prevotella sp. kh1p2]|uniref:OmpA family protein n=1 Tax=Prevotella sp. kh1p2 TaxID=1761883 RepID=UPI0008BAB125|nr:OmpA family protein [Prevotella sp. kh1p2]SET13358.1 Outer membrane protein OmpA [Prevotella sp. kh1p2]SNU11950.1 Outer membrane protein OmpA [Prevotellaceae bacterium KH2P17]